VFETGPSERAPLAVQRSVQQPVQRRAVRTRQGEGEGGLEPGGGVLQVSPRSSEACLASRDEVPQLRAIGLAGAAIAVAVLLFGSGAAMPVALCAAFQVALFEFGRSHDGHDAPRMIVGLVLGALSAHLGWVAIHWPAEIAIGSLASPAGFSVLFVPIGVWLVAPLQDAPRRAYLAHGIGSLPLAIATARLGCVVAGCCGGDRYSTQLIEVFLCTALALATRRLPSRLVASVCLAGLAGSRLLVEPLRGPSPHGMPAIPAEAIAATLLVLGAGALVRTVARDATRGHP
jgi:hypothetical protein